MFYSKFFLLVFLASASLFPVGHEKSYKSSRSEALTRKKVKGIDISSRHREERSDLLINYLKISVIRRDEATFLMTEWSNPKINRLLHCVRNDGP